MAEFSEPSEDLTQTQTVLEGSECCFEFYCYPCNEDGRHVEAVGYCKDCRDYLCDECYRFHRRPKPSRHHVLLDSEHMPKDLASSRRVVNTDICTDTCNKHPDKAIEFYCHMHDTMACSACAFADHRKCDKVDLIADVADAAVNNKELNDTQAKLQDLAQNASQSIQTLQDSISLSNKCKDISIKSVQTYIHETIKSLEHFENELVVEVNELDYKNENKLKADIYESDSILVEIKGTLQSISILEKNKQFCNLFVAVKKAQKTLTTVTGKLDRIRQDSIVDEFKFEPNLKLQSMLRHKEGIGDIIAEAAQSGDRVNQLDSLCVVSDPDSKQTTTFTTGITGDQHKHDSSIDKGLPGNSATCEPNKNRGKDPWQSRANSSIRTDGSNGESVKSTTHPRNESDKSTKNTAFNVKSKDLNAHHISDINVKSESDSKTCIISGVAILPDYKLTAVDHVNNKVKVIDMNKHKMIYEFKLESQPWDVASVDRDRIAVTLPYVSKIQYLNVSADGTISMSRTVNVNGDCYGIAFGRDKLWVSYMSQGKLEALTLDGEVLLCISLATSGPKILPGPWYVALTTDMETIYVTDFNKRSIFLVSSTGKLLSVCAVESAPFCVAVAADGTVYTTSGGVNMLTAQCVKITKLLDERQAGYSAWGLAYDEDTRRLFVGSSDNIKIFYHT